MPILSGLGLIHNSQEESEWWLACLWFLSYPLKFLNHESRTSRNLRLWSLPLLEWMVGQLEGKIWPLVRVQAVFSFCPQRNYWTLRTRCELLTGSRSLEASERGCVGMKFQFSSNWSNPSNPFEKNVWMTKCGYAAHKIYKLKSWYRSISASLKLIKFCSFTIFDFTVLVLCLTQS